MIKSVHLLSIKTASKEGKSNITFKIMAEASHSESIPLDSNIIPKLLAIRQIQPVYLESEKLKYTIFTINSSIYLIYVQDAGESIHILTLNEKDTREIILAGINVNEKTGTVSIKNSKLLNTILLKKNTILDKMTDPQILIKHIGNLSNQYIDKGDYDKAQATLKLKDIPIQMVESWNAMNKLVINNNLVAAIEEINKTITLANKLEEKDIVSFLNIKKNFLIKYPEMYKKAEKIITNIDKNTKRPKEYYKLLEDPKIMDNIEECINIFQKLEIVEKKNKANQLKSILQQAIKSYKQVHNGRVEITNIVGALR